MDAALKSLSYRGEGQGPDRGGIDGRDLGQSLTGMRNDNRPVDDGRPAAVEVAPEPASATRVPEGIETGRPSRAEAEAAVRTLLRWAGDDPTREGLRDTPARVTKAFGQLFGGYEMDAEALLATEVEGQTVAALVEGESARIGEKLVLSRFATFEGTTATYLHKRATDLPPAIGVAVQYSGGTEEAARSLAMHIAAARPRFLSREEVPAETVETERRVAEQTAKEEGKPEQAIVKIVEGRVNAYYKDFVLLEQPSITEPKRTVKQVADDAGLTVERFARFEVGQA